MTLLDRTTEMLRTARAKGESLASIAAESNGAVQKEWLKKFASGGHDPRIGAVQRLHDFLASRGARRRA